MRCWLKAPVFALCLAAQFATAEAAGAECNRPVVSGPEDWYPYSFRDDPSGKPVGAGFDVARRAFRMIGADPVIVDGGPSARLFEGLRNGQIDVVSASFWDNDHTDFAAYSKPYDADEIAAFVSSGKAFTLLSMADLRGRRGVAELGIGYGEAFDRYAETNLMLERVVGGRLLGMVAQGRVDYAVLPRIDGRRKIDEIGLDDRVQALPGIVSVSAVHMMVSRRSPCMAQFDKLNAALDQLQKDRTVLSILETYDSLAPAAGH